MNVKKLSVGERFLGGAALFLLIDLLFLPWHRVGFRLFGASVHESRSAVESPNALLGVLALLVVAAIIAHVVLSEFTSVKLPALPISWHRADFMAAIAVAGLLLLKLLVETDALSYGAWLGIIASGVLVYGGYLRDREEEPSPAEPAL